ncbi:MAG: hypothetical protein ACR2N2_02230 [Acidimicrobiia bacterium]
MPWTGIAVGVALFLPGAISLMTPPQEDDEESIPALRKVLGVSLMLAGTVVLLFTIASLF